jgi:hypothetical protein
VRRGVDVAEVRARVQAALDSASQPVEVVVRAHDLGQLAFPRSLEHWLDRFQLGDVIHDPTMIVARARALLLAARACREAMGSQARGIFFDPARRALLVLAKGGRNGVAASTHAWVRSLVDEAWARAAADADASIAAAAKVSVQAVASLPKGDLVPVDARSASIGRRIGSAMRRWLAPLALVLAAGAIAAPATAKTDGRQPAISSSAAGSAGKQATGPAGFGVLTGLSVFADGQSRYQPDAFASSGLKMFFGSTVQRGQGTQVAQGNIRRRSQVLYDVNPSDQSGGQTSTRRQELFDVDTGTAHGGPGS